MSGAPGQVKTLLQSQVVALLRKRMAVPGQIVAASYEELADELGGTATPRDVRAALVELGSEEFFLGRPHLSDRQFRGRLPE